MAEKTVVIEGGGVWGTYVGRLERAEAERDAALSTIAKVRAAVSGHPKCDQYEDDDAITCGWKNAYASVVRALGSVPSTGEGNE